MKRVLLVDDDELILKFLKIHFENRDFHVMSIVLVCMVIPTYPGRCRRRSER